MEPPGQVAERLTNELRTFIHLDARPSMELIKTLVGGPTVHVGGDQQIQAKSAIVAVPPPLRNKIAFKPDLPAEMRAFLQRSPMGSMIKVFAIYPSAFWRGQEQPSGFAVGNLKTLRAHRRRLTSQRQSRHPRCLRCRQ